MKLSSRWLILSSLCTSRAAASSAPVYAFDGSGTQPSSGSPQAVTPEAARLILAQRLGVSEYHSLSSVEDEVIRQINDFGGSQKHLFSDETGPATLTIMVEGVEKPEDIFPSKSYTPAFSISGPPASSENEQLMSDFSRQNAAVEGGDFCGIDSAAEGGPRSRWRSLVWGSNPTFGRCPSYRDGTPSASERDHVTSLKEFEHVVSSNRFSRGVTVIHMRTLEAIAKEEGISSKKYTEAVKLLAEVFSTFATKAQNGEYTTTVVLMPLSSRLAKRSTNPYGSYDIPQKAPTPRQESPEALLSEAPFPEASNPSSSESQPSQPQTLKATALPRGILPVCHSTLNSCITSTNNCSGHGTCYSKYGSGDSASTDCFACGCKPSIRKNSDGTIKTTYWGGPACQKKDVSMEFFLLAGFFVAMVGAVTWGIGLLFSIGNEPLPSVIGAGVAGPRAK